MGLIGYSCSYIPPELLALTGQRPYRLLHGNIALASAGEQFLRVDACPLVKAGVAYVAAQRREFALIIGSTGCDMNRRMCEVIAQTAGVPTYIFNNPRTRNRDIFDEEIDLLIAALERFSGRQFGPEALRVEIQRWEGARSILRAANAARGAPVATLSTADLMRMVHLFHQGELDRIDSAGATSGDASLLRTRPRVYLTGSPFTYEMIGLIELLERSLHICGDDNCGLTRMLTVQLTAPTLAGLKKAYYDQPPCIMMRPNQGFYEHVRNEIKRRACRGVVAWTLDYCDNFEFELAEMERSLGVPLLRLRSDLSTQNLGPLRTRIEAFAEMLAAGGSRS